MREDQEETKRANIAIMGLRMRGKGKSGKETIAAIRRKYGVDLSQASLSGLLKRLEEMHAGDRRDLAICAAIDSGQALRDVAGDFGMSLAHVEALEREIRK